uniref:Cytochrome P450 71A1-like n=1 Tax=Tanacetum cinerariifolium TaxID=118510 RepID=A0A6L2P678_TANCI|nr:cytochrome P450 71A1-like [Tanacetum cinerariifolium]
MFPFMGWLDKLNGSIARLEKNVKDMDEFYQQLIDEQLNPDKPNIMQEDMVDILLKLKHDQDSLVKLTFDHIKVVPHGATDTSVATVVWTMVLLIKNLNSLKKLQQEVRNVIGNKGKVNEDDLDKLKYLKANLSWNTDGNCNNGNDSLNLIYSFDWESPVKAHEIDTSKSPGAVTHKKIAL